MPNSAELLDGRAYWTRNARPRSQCGLCFFAFTNRRILWGISVASVRMLPAILGVLALPATYFVWRGLIGRRAALWAVVLLSSSSFLIWYSQDAKMYPAVWLLATIAGGAFLHALREQPHRLAWLGAYAISNTAILLTSYVGIVPMFVQGLYGALLVARKRPLCRYVVEAAFIAFISSVPLMIWLTRSHRAATTAPRDRVDPPDRGRPMVHRADPTLHDALGGIPARGGSYRRCTRSIDHSGLLVARCHLRRGRRLLGAPCGTPG